MGDLLSLAASFGDGVFADAQIPTDIMSISNRMCLTRFAHFDLKFPFFYRNMHAAIFYRNIQTATCNMRAICILRCNKDSFLPNQKGLESMSILPKNFCKMHIGRHNMQIAIEYRLPLTHIPISLVDS